MKRVSISLATVFLTILFVLQSPALAAGSGSDDSKVLEFNSMVGVSGPFLRGANPIRGVPGAGAAWTISSAKGELKADGSLEVEVNGLVLVAAQTNPVGFFRAVVSCMSIDANGKASTVNLSTDQFPATREGDSEIEARVDLPSPCIAPIIFVTSPTGAWFAVTGR